MDADTVTPLVPHSIALNVSGARLCRSCGMPSQPSDIDLACRALDRDQGIAALIYAGNAAAAADRVTLAAVRRAREKGTSWARIGNALGVTPQAAQQRFGKRL